MTTDAFDRSTWRDVAAASAAVIAVSQRVTGLWPYPTTLPEVIDYHSGSLDEAFRKPYGSYTVSWSFLLALERLYGEVPPHIRAAVEKWFSENPPHNGSYGTILRDGLTKRWRMDASSRHAAYALLIRLRYAPNYRPEEWWTTIQWILDHKTPDTGKGWKNRADDDDDESMSTAACVGALAYFLARCGDTVRTDRRKQIHSAIRDGVAALASSTDQGRLWSGHREGRTDVIDSALIIELLSSEHVLPQLRASVPDFDATLDRLYRTLLGLASEKGWPATFATRETTLSSTIAVLLATWNRLADSRDPVARERLATSCEYVIEQLRSHNGGAWLLSWEWAYLGSLSVAMVRRNDGRGLTEPERREIQEQATRMARRRYSGSRLLAAAKLPRMCYSPVAFVVTRGRLTFDANVHSLLYMMGTAFRLTTKVVRGILYLKTYGFSRTV